MKKNISLLELREETAVAAYIFWMEESSIKKTEKIHPPAESFLELSYLYDSVFRNFIRYYLRD